ncbi:MAG: hypothetical protein HETSPECPRED_008586 [Heterodermia speciosa]|uniref:Amidohydrolase-related domain-containing protein n=1 Tax=Heterodermia speciosa TaxID=116794 RepID=A0A8H3FYD1_9LECA|nr:MAG: hypothetical protein HETSPECPRED_008586 [Heterodermia speciosa]
MAAQFLKHHGINLQQEMDSIQKEGGIVSPANDMESNSAKPLSRLNGVRMSNEPKKTVSDIFFDSGKVKNTKPHRDSESAGWSDDHEGLSCNQALVLPSLCHPHIHLDKCFLFSHRKYDDLEVVRGDFPEALELTSKAKASFEHDDLVTRGGWLIRESIAAGVTHMRAFVEVDTTVKFKCLDAGLVLKQRFASFCEIQICVFAQDPVFSAGKNYPRGKQLIEEALGREGVDALGSTPYVESSEELMHANVDWAISSAVKYQKHLDLHLDYNLDSTNPPLIFPVLDRLHKTWKSRNEGKTVVLGHCTRLTLFSNKEWVELRDRIADLPVYFVGLPTSDIYMMGKPSDDDGGGQRVRGTLQIPQMIQKYGLKGVIGVNNVGNAFTPQGNCDPLSIASMGVGIYQAGTKADAQVLFNCVSTTAKTAIGFAQPEDPFGEGAPADFVLFENAMLSEERTPGQVRQRRTLQEMIYDPPKQRRTIFQGRLVPTNIVG